MKRRESGGRRIDGGGPRVGGMVEKETVGGALGGYEVRVTE